MPVRQWSPNNRHAVCKLPSNCLVTPTVRTQLTDFNLQWMLLYILNSSIKRPVNSGKIVFQKLYYNLRVRACWPYIWPSLSLSLSCLVGARTYGSALQRVCSASHELQRCRLCFVQFIQLVLKTVACLLVRIIFKLHSIHSAYDIMTYVILILTEPCLHDSWHKAHS
jgi:hypothetical protein